MAFVNLSLLFGGALVAIPVVLHLVMRQKPKQLEFAALRFLKERRVSNRRRLQLRHLLLLLLRCAVVGLLALALARPSVQSAGLGNWLILSAVAIALLLVLGSFALAIAQKKGLVLTTSLGVVALLLLVGLLTLGVRIVQEEGGSLLGDQAAPVAAIVAVDTSLRMQYRHQNATRLENAKEMAQWVVKQLPHDSDVAVIDARVHRAAFAIDRGAAQKMIEGLQATSVSRPIVDVLDDAIQLVRTSEHSRKEIYLMTDLTQVSWSGSSATRLKSVLQQASDVLIYIIDVADDDPQNFSLGPLKLSGQTLSRNSSLHIKTELLRQGPAGEREIHFFIEEMAPDLPVIQDGKPRLPQALLRRRQRYSVETNGSTLVHFQISRLEEGTHHGWVKIVGDDGLAVDDTRYFTVEVRSTTSILIAAPPQASTTFLSEALAPSDFRESDRARFTCEVIPQQDLAQHDFEDYATIYLLDPRPLTAMLWKKIAAYVRAGGSVAIFLGHNMRQLSALNDPAAQEVLPGVFQGTWRAGEQTLFLAPSAMEHELLSAFRPIASRTPWIDFPVLRHLTLEKLSPAARVVIPFSNGRPALIEKILGSGRVLVMTTPISETNRTGKRPNWNRLTTELDDWPIFMLLHEIGIYLAEGGQTKLNYLAGETAEIHESQRKNSQSYFLFTPLLERPQQVHSQQGLLTIQFTESPGIYRLKSSGSHPSRGFSVNVSQAVSQLDRITTERLNEILGSGRYQLARNQEEIDREIGQARIGQEFYQPLILLLALVLGLEHTLANRFYRQQDRESQKS